MLRIATVTALALFAIPTAAFADRAAADKCAKDLSGETLKTYRYGVVAVQKNNATLENAVRGYLEPRYNKGEFTEAEGRLMGEAAAKCIRLLHAK
jgi:hypothetical protein